jgi:ABC-type antimicrobial peptide transport system permease subunit
MLKNYFKTALRSLIRNKQYVIINISGLAVGLAVCLVIAMIIRFEMSFDNFHSKKNRIYRILTEYHHSDAANIFYGRGVPFPLPAAMKMNFREVELSTPFYADYNDQYIILDEHGGMVKKFKEERGTLFTTPDFFQIFDFPWLAGNPAAALRDPNTAVLSKEIAEKYFGDWRSALGKTIRWNNAEILTIKGILNTIPPNSDLQLKVVISMGTGYTARFGKSTNWDGTGSSYGCYVTLAPDVSPSAFNSRLREYVKKMKSPGNNDSHVIQPISQQHYDTEAGNIGGKTMSKSLIRALWLIAGFILLIACINFINLSTAQAVNRAREVGVRKVMGSNKLQLRIQFLYETFLIVMVSLLLAIGLSFLAIPFMSRLLDIPLTMKVLLEPATVSILLLTGLIVTLLAGLYPSFVLSRYNPIEALKSRLFAASTKGISLRKGLVVMQFVIAQALIIGTLVIVIQMNYFSHQPLGFNKDAIVNIPIPEDSVANTKLDFLQKQLSSIAGVENISFSSNTPVEDNNDNWTNFTYNHAGKQTDFYSIVKLADNSYLPTYQLPLVAGRNIYPSDTVREFLVNESLVKSLGIKNPNEVLNRDLQLYGDLHGPIVGVLKDYHDRSFRAPFAPLLITSMRREYNQAGIKLAVANIPAALKSVEGLWNRTFPEFVFEYEFLDSKIDNFYKEENKLSQIYKLFASIAIFLSCLGLYGLASFMAVQRIREVGIRKVLGATSSSIVYLFSREFLILVCIAFLIASPIAWFFMNKWLQDYVYRINISWWLFAAGGLLSILIALLTVSTKAIQAAWANPVKSLRTE